jgi:hypothetical protein
MRHRCWRHGTISRCVATAALRLHKQHLACVWWRNVAISRAVALRNVGVIIEKINSVDNGGISVKISSEE